MTYERFLEKLKEVRKQRECSIQTLSKKIGISTSSLSYVERGKVTLSVEKLLSLCQALEIEPSSLFIEENEAEDKLLTEDFKALPKRDQKIIKSLIYIMCILNATS